MAVLAQLPECFPPVVPGNKLPSGAGIACRACRYPNTTVPAFQDYPICSYLSVASPVITITQQPTTQVTVLVLPQPQPSLDAYQIAAIVAGCIVISALIGSVLILFYKLRLQKEKQGPFYMHRGPDRIVAIPMSNGSTDDITTSSFVQELSMKISKKSKKNTKANRNLTALLDLETDALREQFNTEIQTDKLEQSKKEIKEYIIELKTHTEKVKKQKKKTLADYEDALDALTRI
ncbi:hypothetical protein EDD86DRAFT_276014 [Gorgonomyces haynaldii]|nr:hypothetical protein EDD86DRAFT_276014 [Gorgonomyces haynaldii]